MCLLGLKRSRSFYFYPLEPPDYQVVKKPGMKDNTYRERENWLE